ncbi:uncharacterized protein TNCV_4327771 [Trichonephila clavipes]|nr:uncharacterized protein TNCV_4327771 [Trichonephila clavipes]
MELVITIINSILAKALNHRQFKEFLFQMENDEEPIDICQLPPEKSGCLTVEEDISEDTFQSVLPADFCGKIKISTNIDNDKKSHEDVFDPEEPSNTKGMSNLKTKLKSNETNVELRGKKNLKNFQH